MAYTLTWEPNGVYWKYTGNVSGKEIIKASTEIYGDQRFDKLKYKLVDFSDVESIDISNDEINQITFQHAAASLSKSKIKNAIIIDSNDDRAKMFADYLANNSDWEVRVFDYLKDANEWIGR